jgi:3-hydroxyisobutyrate dehydrogenase-like beta-hydroxyacid dehydrogenase
MAQTQTRIQVVNETPRQHDGKWQLRLQWCRYLHADGSMQYGYRFIWLRPDGSLQATRGQARLPSFAAAERLFAAAKAEGWGDQDGDAMA